MDYLRAKDFILSKLEKELSPSLYYHSVTHTMDVIEACERFGQIENVTGEDFVLLQTAALYHDVGFIVRYESNEEIACEIARETLPGYNYTQSQIDIICNIIMATKIPQNPHNLLEEIICDADLDYLGRNDFFITALKLHREWTENNGLKTTFKDWYIKQNSFVLKHNYFTGAANNLRQEKKNYNLSQINELLALFDSTITNPK